MGRLNRRLTHTTLYEKCTHAECTLYTCTCMHTHLPLLVVNTRKVPVNYGVVGTEAEGTEISSYSSVEYPGLLQHVAQVDVGIQERRVQLNCLDRGRRKEEREGT